MRGGFWNIVLVLVLGSVLMGLMQLGIIAVVIWGLIFRTRQTVCMLATLLFLGLLSRYPPFGLCLMLFSFLAYLLPDRSDKSNANPTIPQLPDK